MYFIEKNAKGYWQWCGESDYVLAEEHKSFRYNTLDEVPYTVGIMDEDQSDFDEGERFEMNSESHQYYLFQLDAERAMGLLNLNPDDYTVLVEPDVDNACIIIYRVSDQKCFKAPANKNISTVQQIKELFIKEVL